MKNILLIYFTILNSFSYGQTEWAPIGASWYYNTVNYCGNDGRECGYFRIESIRDTFILNKTAKLLQVEYHERFSNYPVGYEIMYGENGYIYHYKNNSFYVLYNFNATAGDTITVFDVPFSGYLAFHQDGTFSNFKYIVDSTSNIIINYQILKVLYIRPFFSGSSGSQWIFSDKIIERIGDIELMFGRPNIVYPEYGGGIRCYNDSLINYKPYNRECDFIVDNIEQIENTQFNIYPIPVIDNLQIDYNGSYLLTIPRTFRLLNILGSEIINKPILINQSTIDLSFLNSGIYYLEISTNSKKYYKAISKL